MDFAMPILNLIDRALPSVGLNGKIELPKIIVTGEQSAGKSSVLEAIAGFEFLPRDKKMCTKCPIRIEMNKILDDNEYAEIVSHKNDRIGLNDIRDQLSELMNNLLKGKNNDVTEEEIHLRIYKKNIVNLTLVDLPGYVSNIGEGQSMELPKKIEKMVEKYAKSKNTIILTVVSGHVDPATWKSSKFAKKWDFSGERTVCVITKVDIDTRGESQIEDLLRGFKYPLKNGYIAVKCRSQKDSENGVTLEQSLKDEKEFFMESDAYGDIADTQGIEYLRSKLKLLLLDYIQSCLPVIKSKLTVLLDNDENSYLGIGAKIDFKDDNEALPAILKIISRYCTKYIEDMKGMNVRNCTEVLTGGARIYRIMRESFCKKLDEMNPFKNLSDTNILTAINVSRNVNPELLIPEEAFRSLIKQLIATFDSPCKQLVTLIYDEMVNALHKVKDPELDKYERLKDFIISRMIEFFSECKKNALIHTENIIECEDAYINVEHDDLVHLKDICTMKNVPDSDRLRIYYILDMLNIKKSLFKETLNLNDEIIREEEEKAFERSNNENRNIVDVDRTNVTERANEALNIEENRDESEEEEEKEANSLSQDNSQFQQDDNMGQEAFATAKKDEQILLAHRDGKDFFNTFNPKDNLNIRDERVILNRIGNNLESEPKTKFEKEEVIVVKMLIECYFSVLKKQIKDLIQKCMVCKFFNKIDRMNLFITESLFERKIDIKSLLLETDAVINKRDRLEKRIKVLKVFLRALNRSSNIDVENDRIELEYCINQLRASKFKDNFDENEEESKLKNPMEDEVRLDQQNSGGFSKKIEKNFKEKYEKSKF